MEFETLRTRVEVHGPNSLAIIREFQLLQKLKEIEEKHQTVKGLCESIWEILGALEIFLRRRGYKVLTFVENFKEDEYAKLFIPPSTESLIDSSSGVLLMMDIIGSKYDDEVEIDEVEITIADIPPTNAGIANIFLLHAYNYLRHIIASKSD